MYRLLTFFLVGIFSTNALAEVTRFEIIQVESPAFEGRAFGEVGQYEKIIARAYMEVDPEDEHNAEIVDLARAPRNSAGRVEYATDVEILKPIDLGRSNNRIFFGVVNRGYKNLVSFLNDAPRTNNLVAAEHAGNGFLMREGYTLVWSAWQGDLRKDLGRPRIGPPNMYLDVPVVSGLTGRTREEIIFNNNYDPFVASLSYPSATLDVSDAVLTVRQNEQDARVTPPDLLFQYFAVNAGRTGGLSNNQILVHRPAGFDAGAIYEFAYTARDPAIMGLGFAATRDVISFLRRRGDDALGNPNPLAVNGNPVVEFAYTLGISQSGRYLRDFLYQGFNEDEGGQIVFDGMIPQVGGSRKTYVNYRWAKPGEFSQQHETHLTPGDQFPFTYAVLTDSLTGKRDGILGRCLASQTCPKVMHTDSPAEFWQGRSSLVVTDTKGEDITLPENVRFYFFAGVAHYADAGATPRSIPMCQNQTNALYVGAPLRALVRALDAWVADGTEPPESRYPTRGGGTLVLANPQSMNFPEIPRLKYNGNMNEIRVTEYNGLEIDQGDAYPVFVPKVDEDGNDLGGVRLPEITVPRGTYLGWNYRSEGYAPGELCENWGSFIPFASTRAEREASADPRLSLEERYESQEDYRRQVRAAADVLVEAGFLLAEDLNLVVDRATQE